MARLDRLGAGAREIAQIGAAIGREFSYELVAAVAPRGEAETRGRARPARRRRPCVPARCATSGRVQFKHALVQDTAYGTLLRGPRQALHGRIAAAIARARPGNRRARARNPRVSPCRSGPPGARRHLVARQAGERRGAGQPRSDRAFPTGPRACRKTTGDAGPNAGAPNWQFCRSSDHQRWPFMAGRRLRSAR